MIYAIYCIENPCCNKTGYWFLGGEDEEKNWCKSKPIDKGIINLNYVYQCLEMLYNKHQSCKCSFEIRIIG